MLGTIIVVIVVVYAIFQYNKMDSGGKASLAELFGGLLAGFDKLLKFISEMVKNILGFLTTYNWNTPPAVPSISPTPPAVPSISPTPPPLQPIPPSIPPQPASPSSSPVIPIGGPPPPPQVSTRPTGYEVVPPPNPT